MKDLQKELKNLPIEINKALNIGFVFVKENDHYWHFPARQWPEKQIQAYFLERFGEAGDFVSYPELKIKQLIIQTLPQLLIVVPYDFKKEDR
ncbi:hypothetical protein CF160_05240 [Enterococcus pseudoavium]|nr:hypothetical protein CF160_05240 [Enterococcus pseudoavium]